VRIFLCDALESQGYRVLAAGDGRQALALLETAAPPPAAVITDVVMRAMGGRELAERLRRAHPGLPILFICGHVAQPTRGQLPGDEPLLRKPFSPFDLARELRRVLALRS
jgi:CheY-like chemotaxis protein